MDTLLTLGIAFIAGIFFYYMDLNKGRRWNTRWYDLTHQHKSPSLLEKGLIHLQPFQQKLVMAIVIAGLFTAVAIAVGGAHALLDLITGGIAVVGLLLGFYAAVFLFKGKRWNMEPVREVLNKVDRIEAEAHGEKHDIPSRKDAEPAKPTRSADPPDQHEQKAPEPGDDRPDWRAGIKKFTDK
ncbi:MAG: hypothetical protein IPH05_02425 [Flavobacteriales bacterium]|nr:hypothetical protein [Flavobacteriales bacterium]MBK6881803.1 hypothetical protein [Flavobacteriales bacterium]